jgi:hypothetical protein
MRGALSYVLIRLRGVVINHRITFNIHRRRRHHHHHHLFITDFLFAMVLFSFEPVVYPTTQTSSFRLYYYYYYYYYYYHHHHHHHHHHHFITGFIFCYGTSPLEPLVHPTTQASSFRL